VLVSELFRLRVGSEDVSSVPLLPMFAAVVVARVLAPTKGEVLELVVQEAVGKVNLS
jgi:hypothetical protein